MLHARHTAFCAKNGIIYDIQKDIISKTQLPYGDCIFATRNAAVAQPIHYSCAYSY